MSRKPATRTEMALYYAALIFVLLIAADFTWGHPAPIRVLTGVMLWVIVGLGVALILQDHQS